MDWIPGHVRAVWWKWLALVGLAGALSDNLQVSAGVALVLVGNFLEDQATHLSQMSHRDADVSGLEQAMQSHHIWFRLLGFALSLLGVYVAFRA